jgi:hypothetical protein
VLTKNKSTHNLASNIAESVTHELTMSLHETARAANWPGELINALEVINDNGSVYVSYPDQLKQRIEDLEYGSTNESPNSVIRPFINRAVSTLSNETKNGVMDYMNETGAGGIW